jgi:hypothetical protein
MTIRLPGWMRMLPGWGSPWKNGHSKKLGDPLGIDVLGAQLFEVAEVARLHARHEVLHPDAGDELADDDTGAAEVVIELGGRGVELLPLLEIPPEELLVSHLQMEVELLEEHQLELDAEGRRDPRPQHGEELRRPQDPAESGQVRLEVALDVRPADLDRDHLAGHQARLVHARDGGPAEGREIEFGEGRLQRLAGPALDDLADIALGDRFGVVQQLLELPAIDRVKHVRADGHLLADLDERPSQALEDPAQPDGPPAEQDRFPPRPPCGGQPIEDSTGQEIENRTRQLDQADHDAEGADPHGLVVLRQGRLRAAPLDLRCAAGTRREGQDRARFSLGIPRVSPAWGLPGAGAAFGELWLQFQHEIRMRRCDRFRDTSPFGGPPPGFPRGDRRPRAFRSGGATCPA